MNEQLSNNAVTLAQNAYGNYSLQVAFDVSKQIFNHIFLELANRRMQVNF